MWHALAHQGTLKMRRIESLKSRIPAAPLMFHDDSRRLAAAQHAAERGCIQQAYNLQAPSAEIEQDAGAVHCTR